MIRMKSERVIQIQKDVQLRFIHYANVFDNARHKDPFELLGKLHLFGNVLE